MATFGLALLEVIEKDYFKSTLCIDVDDDAIKDALVLRSKFVTFIKSHEIGSELDFSNDFFDLIISYSDSKPILHCLSEIQHSDNCEILIVSSNLFTYSSSSIKKYFFERRFRMSLLFDIKKLFSNFILERYYPFPNIYAPEMILMSTGISTLYFRYWSWRAARINIVSKVIEYVLLRGLKITNFSPHMIVKLSKNHD